MGNERYEKYKKSYEVYRKKNKKTYKKSQKAYREKNKEYLKQQKKEWIRKNPKKRLLCNRKSKNKVYFGGNRNKAFERDNWSCQECGMTNKQHLIVFKKIITMHHISGNKKDSSLNNLVTLCLRCHVKKDRRRIVKEKEAMKR